MIAMGKGARAVAEKAKKIEQSALSRTANIHVSNRLSYILLGIVFLAGLGLLLYPTVSDYWNSFHQSRAIMNYAEAVEAISKEDYGKFLGEAAEYNQRILSRANPFVPGEEEAAEYEELLNVGGNGIMGYVEIPIINVSLPIYHGTSESVLQVAVGHLDWSSLPVGGESTHCVLSGHRGLPSARLFTDLDKIVEGDVFLIYVLDQVLTYEVDQILIVLPEDLAPLRIIPGGDYCTLVTCTPYGINTHRILVRGHRIDNIKSAESIRVTADSIQIEPVMVMPFVAAPLLLLLTVWLFADDRRMNIAPDEDLDWDMDGTW